MRGVFIWRKGLKSSLSHPSPIDTPPTSKLINLTQEALDGMIQGKGGGGEDVGGRGYESENWLATKAPSNQGYECHERK